MTHNIRISLINMSVGMARVGRRSPEGFEVDEDEGDNVDEMWRQSVELATFASSVPDMFGICS